MTARPKDAGIIRKRWWFDASLDLAVSPFLFQNSETNQPSIASEAMNVTFGDRSNGAISVRNDYNALVELPVQSEKTRTPQEAWTMAVAIQANLMTLVVADSKRRGIKPKQHDIAVRPPGAVKHFRETLIDPKLIAGYSDIELHLRMREIWGQFCLMGWLFSLNDPAKAGLDRRDAVSINFTNVSNKLEMHCETALRIKDAEIRGFLWKMLFEQRRRLDASYEKSSAFSREFELAKQIPAQGFGKPIEKLTGEQLLFLSCEYAGMLGAIRWVMNPTLAWGAPGIMDVGESPFDTAQNVSG